MAAMTDASFRLRVYYNFIDDETEVDGKKPKKHYELYHLENKEEKFRTLKEKIFARRGIDAKLSSFFYFTLQRLHAWDHGESATRPSDFQSVFRSIDKEEMRWPGDGSPFD